MENLRRDHFILEVQHRAVSLPRRSDLFRARPCHDKKALQAWFNCCFTSTETVGLLGDGGAQDVQLDFNTQLLGALH